MPSGPYPAQPAAALRAAAGALQPAGGGGPFCSRGAAGLLQPAGVAAPLQPAVVAAGPPGPLSYKRRLAGIPTSHTDPAQRINTVTPQHINIKERTTVGTKITVLSFSANVTSHLSALLGGALI